MLTGDRVVAWLARIGVAIGACVVSLAVSLLIAATGASLWVQIALSAFCGPCIGAAMAPLMRVVAREWEP